MGRKAPKGQPGKAIFQKGADSQQLQQQVHILHVGLSGEEKPVTFAIDPCRGSSPDQLVLARTERKATLAATLAEVEKAIASFPSDSENGGFIPGDQLWIPVLNMDVEHHFRELEGRKRPFLNNRMRGQFLGTAVQTVRFKLDANGAEMASTGRGAAIKLRPVQNLTFNRPFIIYARKRGGKLPFLVMWIDNHGLMQAKESRSTTTD
jgi:hypothetical protein